MASLKSVFKNFIGPTSMARQFFVWTIVANVIQSALGPFFQAIQNQANHSNPNTPASPADLASFVVRGVVEKPWAADEARKSGYSPQIFDLMVENAGGPPAIGDMLSLLRRGKATRDEVIRAIRQSSVKNEWIDTILKLGIQPPTPTDILDALLQGQIEPGPALQLYTQLGGDPDHFDLLFNTRGGAPTPNQAAEMAQRGIIPWDGAGAGVVSYTQAFLEGPWRNKWLKPFQDYAAYTPPPETIGAMYRRGSLTLDKAHVLLAHYGVPVDMFDAYLFDNSSGNTAKAKELTESTISTLYQENAISESDAHDFLLALRYTSDEADFVITAWQLARDLKFRNTAITTVHTQFINHKIDAGTASTLMDRFGVPPGQRDQLIALWTEEAKAKVTLLTAAQIKAAWKKGRFDDQQALSRLTDLGYSEDDANIYLNT